MGEVLEVAIRNATDQDIPFIVETIIQAVSPLLGTMTGAGAASAAGAAAGAVAGAAAGAFASALASTFASAAGAVCAMATPPKHNVSPSAKEANNFFILFSLSASSKSFCTGFTGADANDLFQVVYKHLAVANLAGAGTGLNGFDHALDQVV